MSNRFSITLYPVLFMYHDKNIFTILDNNTDTTKDRENRKYCAGERSFFFQLFYNRGKRIRKCVYSLHLQRITRKRDESVDGKRLFDKPRLELDKPALVVRNNSAAMRVASRTSVKRKGELLWGGDWSDLTRTTISRGCVSIELESTAAFVATRNGAKRG